MGWSQRNPSSVCTIRSEDLTPQCFDCERGINIQGRRLVLKTDVAHGVQMNAVALIQLFDASSAFPTQPAAPQQPSRGHHSPGRSHILVPDATVTEHIWLSNFKVHTGTWCTCRHRGCKSGRADGFINLRQHLGSSVPPRARDSARVHTRLNCDNRSFSHRICFWQKPKESSSF